MWFRIGVLAIGPSLGLLAQISVVPIPSEIRPYVSVLTYGTEPYDRALKELVPTSSVSTISSMLPYSVILQNISNDTIKGINVVFRIEGQDGKIRPNSVLTTVLDALD